MSVIPLIILASNSPRRRQLLGLSGWQFEVQAADIDETSLPGEHPSNYVVRLAEEKSRAAAELVSEDALIISADTTVADGNMILGKPESPQEAARVLRSLRGRTHQVFTGLAVYRPADDALLVDIAMTDVPMREYTDQEIEDYIATGDPFDKAGSYAIQHPEFRPVSQMSGCYANVMGLPLCHLARTMKKLGFDPIEDIPTACQNDLAYDCPVFQPILKGDL